MTIDLQYLATLYAPELRLYPYETQGDPNYAPCSVEWYLGQVELHLPNGEVLPPSPNLINQLPTTKPAKGQPNPYLLIPDPSGQANSSVRNGDLAQASAYVHIMQTQGSSGSNVTFDLQYWFFYAVRGMSTLRIQGPNIPGIGQIGDVNGDFTVLPSTESEPKYQGCGEHQGDWKTVTVRITAPSSTLPNGRVVGVFYGQHASGIWCKPGEFDTTSTGRPGPVVYSARNAHSCFPKSGRFDQINFDHDYTVLHISLLEWTRDGGDTWDCSQNLVTIANDTEKGFPTPAWVNFYGDWGPTYNQNPANGFASAILQCVNEAGGNLAGAIQSATSGLAPIVEAWIGRPENGANTPPMQNPYWSQGPGALPPQTLPGQSSPFGAALAATPDFLYVGWTGADGNHTLNVWPTATGAFTGSKSSGQQSNDNLALTVFTPPGGPTSSPLLYAAWTGAAGSGPMINVLPVTDSNNNMSWSESKKDISNNYKAGYSPAIAAFAPAGTAASSLYLAWVQQSLDNLLVSASPTGDFSKDGTVYSIGGSSTTGPALIAFDGALRLIWTDRDSAGALTIFCSPSGTFSPSELPLVRLSHTSSVTPAAAVFNESLYLAWMEKAVLWVWSSNDGTFNSGTTGQLVQIPSGSPGPAQAAPALAVFDNLLYLAWIDTQHAIHLMTSDDGVDFF